MKQRQRNNSTERSFFKSFGAACNVWQVDMKMRDGTLFEEEHESENMLIPTTTTTTMTKMKEEKSMNWDQILILKYVWQMMKSVFACTSQMHLLILSIHENECTTIMMMMLMMMMGVVCKLEFRQKQILKCRETCAMAWADCKMASQNSHLNEFTLRENVAMHTPHPTWRCFIMFLRCFWQVEQKLFGKILHSHIPLRATLTFPNNRHNFMLRTFCVPL